MSTSLSATLMEFLNSIFGDETERAAFLANPDGYLDQHGLGDLSCEDFNDALREFVDANPNIDDHFEPVERGDGEDDHEAIAQHLTRIVQENTYVNNEYDYSTNVDNSFHGTINNDDGTITFDNDTVVATDGGVAAGDDINGNTNTGDIDADDSGIVFGDGNARGGDDTTTTTEYEDSFNTDTTTNQNSFNEDNDDFSNEDSGNTTTEVVTEIHDNNVAGDDVDD